MPLVIAVDPGGLLDQGLKSFLARHGFQLLSVRDPSEATRALEGGKVPVVLLCLSPEENTETLLKDLEGLQLPLLAVSSRLDLPEGAARSDLRLIVPPRPYPLLLALEELTKGLALQQEQERLLEEIGHQRFALAVFSEVGKALTSTLKLHEVLNIIAEKISSLVSWEAWSLLLLDEERGELSFEMATGRYAAAIRGSPWRSVRFLLIEGLKAIDGRFHDRPGSDQERWRGWKRQRSLSWMMSPRSANASRISLRQGAIR